MSEFCRFVEILVSSQSYGRLFHDKPLDVLQSFTVLIGQHISVKVSFFLGGGRGKWSGVICSGGGGGRMVVIAPHTYISEP